MEPFKGRFAYDFPGPRAPLGDKPISENALRNTLLATGWSNEEVTAHGFRATARTLLDEKLGWRFDWIETQFGHVVKDPNGRADNRTSFIDERSVMLQAWVDHLDALRDTNGEVDPAPFKPAARLQRLPLPNRALNRQKRATGVP